MMAADGNEDTMHEALRSKKIGFMPPSRQLGTVAHCIQLTELYIYTNTFINLDKYIWQFRQIRLSI